MVRWQVLTAAWHRMALLSKGRRRNVKKAKQEADVKKAVVIAKWHKMVLKHCQSPRGTSRCIPIYERLELLERFMEGQDVQRESRDGQDENTAGTSSNHPSSSNAHLHPWNQQKTTNPENSQESYLHEENVEDEPTLPSQSSSSCYRGDRGLPEMVVAPTSGQAATRREIRERTLYEINVEIEEWKGKALQLCVQRNRITEERKTLVANQGQLDWRAYVASMWQKEIETELSALTLKAYDLAIQLRRTPPSIRETQRRSRRAKRQHREDEASLLSHCVKRVTAERERVQEERDVVASEQESEDESEEESEEGHPSGHWNDGDSDQERIHDYDPDEYRQRVFGDHDDDYVADGHVLREDSEYDSAYEEFKAHWLPANPIGISVVSEGGDDHRYELEIHGNTGNSDDIQPSDFLPGGRLEDFAEVKPPDMGAHASGSTSARGHTYPGARPRTGHTPP